MRIYKPKYPERQTVDGERITVKKNGKTVYRQNSKYYIEYTDAEGVQRRVPGYTDKAATEQLAAKIRRKVERQQAGIIDFDLNHLDALLQQHLDAWLADLRRSGRCEGYIHKVEQRVDRLRDDLGWATLASIRPDKITNWMTKQAVAGVSSGTLNHYLDAVRAFCNWCVDQGRMAESPVNRIQKTTNGKPVKQRRALRPDEVRRLLAVAPPNRRLVYTVAILTGLRRAELKSLRWGDLRLDDSPGVVLRTEATKSRRADTLPLSEAVAEQLRSLRPDDVKPTTLVFQPVPKLDTFYRDSEGAGIERTAADGTSVDFHALRNMFCTLFAQSGCTQREAMVLMRHTDIRLTANTYTDPRNFDLRHRIAGIEGIVDPKTNPNGDRPDTDRNDPREPSTGPDELAAAISSGISDLPSSDDMAGHSRAAKVEEVSELDKPARSTKSPIRAVSAYSKAGFENRANDPRKQEAGGIESPTLGKKLRFQAENADFRRIDLRLNLSA